MGGHINTAGTHLFVLETLPRHEIKLHPHPLLRTTYQERELQRTLNVWCERQASIQLGLLIPSEWYPIIAMHTHDLYLRTFL